MRRSDKCCAVCGDPDTVKVVIVGGIGRVSQYMCDYDFSILANEEAEYHWRLVRHNRKIQ